MNKILNENVDVDRLLVATFTNAAASEMKERLLEKIYAEVNLHPDNENLQKQISLINRAHISTLHSFCLDVIRNNFYELGMSANFRIGDPVELDIIEQEAIEKVFEDKYETEDEDFLNLLDQYTSYKQDDELKELVLKIYAFIQTMPNSIEWLEEAVNDFKVDENIKDFAETKWGKIIIENSKDIIEIQKNNLEKARNMVFDEPELMDCRDTLIQDIELFDSIKFDTWDEFVESILNIGFSKWSGKRPKGEIKELKDNAKLLRDDAKSGNNKNCK